MFDSKYCNGYGEYSVSETLHRLYLSCGLLPWECAAQAFNKKETLQRFLNSPLLMNEEQYLYRKDFNPVCFGPKQKTSRTEFRLNFIQVYRRLKWYGVPVIAFMFEKEGTKERHSVYTVACKDGSIEYPLYGFPKSKVTEKILQIYPDAQFNIQQSIEETWFRFSAVPLTEDVLGVGSHDFMHPSIENLLKEKGFAENKKPKGPVRTEKKQRDIKSSEEDHKESPPKKRKMNGKTLRRIRQKIYARGERPKHPKLPSGHPKPSTKPNN